MDVKKRGRIIKYSVVCGMTVAGALVVCFLAPPPRKTAWVIYLVMIALIWVMAVMTPVRRRSPRQKVALFLGPIFFGWVTGLGASLGHAIIGLLIGALIFATGVVYAGMNLNAKADGDS
jgi:hypothetical protein